jgi:restriction system protein
MNFLNTAYEILKQAHEPLHYAEIAKRGLDAGLLDTKGQTPEASMGSRLYVDTKRPGSRFRRVSRGVFDLTEGQPSEISQRIDAINQQTRAELRKRLLQMPPDRFEALIGELLLALGFDEETIQVTSYSGDGGIDVRGVLNAGDITQVSAAVQAKRWKKNILAPVVQALRGSLVVHEQGIIITTSKFSNGAIAEASAPGKTRISLIDGDKLLDLLIQHRIGITAEQYTVHSLDEEWWGEVAGETEIPPEPPIPPIVTYPLLIQATAHGQTAQAELLDASGRVRYAGTEYQSPSGAGKAATGWKACDGWLFWRYQCAETGKWREIRELRKY